MEGEAEEGRKKRKEKKNMKKSKDRRGKVRRLFPKDASSGRPWRVGGDKGMLP